MGRKNQGGHIRRLGGETEYRLIRIMVDGRSKQVLEHRHVMEQHIGRKLLRSEIIHHKDENGLNNEISNLELMPQAEHQRHHMMKGPKKWDLDEGIRLRDEGFTLAYIADKFDISEHSVLMAFKRRGISTKDRRHGKNSWDVEAAKSSYDGGMPMKEVAKKAGVSATSVRKAFIKRGWI